MPVQENPHFRGFFALRSSIIDAISRFPIPGLHKCSGQDPHHVVQKTGSGIGNDKNPVFLAEINSGNRPYCRFFSYVCWHRSS